MNPNVKTTRSLAAAGIATILALASTTASASGFLPRLLGNHDQAPLPPIPNLDIERYVGEWFQLAAIPQFFNLQCARDTRAEYAVVNEYSISVVNSCTTWFGRTSKVEGGAVVVGPDSNAQLRVEFDVIPFGNDSTDPNYVVTYIDEDYSWALVGSPDRSSGFVLSREPAIPDEKWADIQDVIQSRGYDLWRFWTSPTSEGKSTITPLSSL